MKSTIKIETLGKNPSLFVCLGDHVLKTYNDASEKTKKAAQKWAQNWANRDKYNKYEIVFA